MGIRPADGAPDAGGLTEQPLPFSAGDVSDVPRAELLVGDVVAVLPTMPDAYVHTIITSPPYWGLRNYGIPPTVWPDGQTVALGLEEDLQSYIRHLVHVFALAKRVLHPKGSLWLNLGDCYASGGKHVEPHKYAVADGQKPERPRTRGLSGKDLLMVPARVALALQEDGWILRQDNIWAKGLSFCPTYAGSVMPESTRDRTTWAHEHVFHLQLAEDAYYDQDGCREPFSAASLREAAETYTGTGVKDYESAGVQNPSDVKRRVIQGLRARLAGPGAGRNLRNVWVIPKQAFKGAHFATFPERLPATCIALGTSAAGACSVCGAQYVRVLDKEPVPDDIRQAFEAARGRSAERTGRTDGHTQRRPNYVRKVIGERWEAGCTCAPAQVHPARVFDPFNGSGRTGIAALKLGRAYTGIELNPDYARLAADALASAASRKETP